LITVMVAFLAAVIMVIGIGIVSLSLNPLQ